MRTLVEKGYDSVRAYEEDSAAVTAVRATPLNAKVSTDGQRGMRDAKNKIEILADRIAEEVFYHFTDFNKREHLCEVLIDFANEIKRTVMED